MNRRCRRSGGGGGFSPQSVQRRRLGAGTRPLAPGVAVHDTVQDRFRTVFYPGLAELVVGKNASQIYEGFTLGDSPKFGGRTWRVVGIMDAKGSAFDSENLVRPVPLSQTYHAP